MSLPRRVRLPLPRLMLQSYPRGPAATAPLLEALPKPTSARRLIVDRVSLREGGTCHGHCPHARCVLRSCGTPPAARAGDRPSRRPTADRAPAHRQSPVVRSGHRLPLGRCTAGAGLLRPNCPSLPPALGGDGLLGPAARRLAA